MAKELCIEVETRMTCKNCNTTVTDDFKDCMLNKHKMVLECDTGNKRGFQSVATFNFTRGKMGL